MCLEMGCPLRREGLLHLLYLMRHEPHKNTSSNSSSIVACVFIAAGTCLLSVYASVYPPIVAKQRLGKKSPYRC
jgi:hypothetical protein